MEQEMSFFRINKHSLEVFKHQLLQLPRKRGKALKLQSKCYQPVTPALTFKMSTFCARDILMCTVTIVQKKSIERKFFLMETRCAFFSVGSQCMNIILTKISFKGVEIRPTA